MARRGRAGSCSLKRTWSHVHYCVLKGRWTHALPVINSENQSKELLTGHTVFGVFAVRERATWTREQAQERATRTAIFTAELHTHECVLRVEPRLHSTANARERSQVRNPDLPAR